MIAENLCTKSGLLFLRTREIAPLFLSLLPARFTLSR